MKIYKSTFFILAILSLIIAIYQIYNAVQSYINKEINLIDKVGIVFVSIGVSSIFFNAFFLKYKEIKGTLPIFFSKTIPLTLLIITVICLSAYHYLLLEDGFSNVKELYWQLFSILMALGEIYFLYSIMKNYKEIKN